VRPVIPTLNELAKGGVIDVIELKKEGAAVSG
jgi:hypothetical protein